VYLLALLARTPPRRGCGVNDQGRLQLEALARALAAASAAAAELATLWHVETGLCSLERDLSLTEVARLLDMSVSGVRGWAEAGRFPGGYKVGRRWRIPESALAAFRAAQAGSTRPAGLGVSISAPSTPRAARRRARPSEAPDLGAWREVRKPDAD
jgi:excisionase family DNA binding protein